MPASEHGHRMGHEFLGVVEDAGTDVPGLKRGDVVVAPFVCSDGTCVLAARRLGAEQIFLMGRHKDRTDLGREFGATDVVAERDAEGIERVRELTGGDGAHTVLECVGTAQAIRTALGTVRAGGVVSRVGAPQYTEMPMDFGTFMSNITRNPVG